MTLGSPLIIGGGGGVGHPTSGDEFHHYYRQALAPTASDPLEVGDLWSDTTANLLKRCTSLSPITFVSVEGSGGVTGPGSSVDNSIVRFDGTDGQTVQGYTSGDPVISDTGTITLVQPLILDDTSLQIQEGVDTLTITVPTLTEARAITFGDLAGEVVLDSAIQTLTNKSIDGGTIDGAVIGGASAAAITGTTIVANTSVSTDSLINASGSITLTPATDTLFANATGIVVGHTAQVAFGEVTGEFQVLGTTNTDTFIGIGCWSTTEVGVRPQLKFLKSGNATIGSNAVVADNEELGSIAFYADDGTDFDTLVADILVNVNDVGPSAGAIGGEILFRTADTVGTIATALTIDNLHNLLVPDGNSISSGLTLGTGKDTRLYYNGTDMIWDLRAVGTAALMISLAASFPSPDPDAVHIFRGSAGVVTADAASVLVLESNQAVFLTLLSPDNATPGLLFGTPTNNAHGGFVYFGPTASPASTMEIRTGGNITRVRISANATAWQEAVTLSTTADDMTLNPTASLNVTLTDDDADAFDLSNSASVYYLVNTINTVEDTIVHLFDTEDATFAAAATSIYTLATFNAYTLTLTGSTQVTSLIPNVAILAQTITDASAVTVDKATSLQIVAPTEAGSVTLTAASAIRILNAGGTPTNQYGIYIEDLTVGANDYGIYIQGADTYAIWVDADPVRFDGTILSNGGAQTICDASGNLASANGVASFGPSDATSFTVVNGIITAIS